MFCHVDNNNQQMAIQREMCVLKEEISTHRRPGKSSRKSVCVCVRAVGLLAACLAYFQLDERTFM